MGLTSTGFTVQTIDEIRLEIEADAKGLLGDNLDVSATSVVGQLIGLFAEREHELQEMARDVWSAFTPGGSTGASLTELSLITGTIREDATFSRVTATVNLNAGVTLPAGSQASVDGDPEAIFETVADATNSGGSPDDVEVVMQATEPGEVRANAGTLTEIVTPFSGWNSVTNVLDATVGEEDEEDEDLRLRRETELRVQGSSNIDAIEADVSTVDGVVDTASFENDTDATVDGLPPHSFEIVVWSGDPAAADEDEIAQAIWDSKPVGIPAIGNTTGTAVDAAGNERTIAFSYADNAEVYLEFDLTTNDEFPVDGEDQVKDAVVAFADDNWRIGSDVILSALYASVFSVSGVVSIDAVRAGFSASPVGTSNLTIEDREIALADSSRIEVNV